MMREILGPLIDIQHVTGMGHVEPCPSSLSAFAAKHRSVLVNGIMVPYRVILGKQRLKGCGDDPRVQNHGHHLISEGWGKHLRYPLKFGEETEPFCVIIISCGWVAYQTE